MSVKDRHAGYVYQLSTLQLEVARTEVFDRPLHGRQFFEEVVHQQLDLGRPDRLQLVFGRQLRGRHRLARTRVFNADTHISLNVEHCHTHLKQYWKLNRCLRTETTFNDSYDVNVGRKLTNENLAKLIAIGIDYNRRLLEMERAACRPSPAASDFERLISPTGPPGRRAPGFRFGDPELSFSSRLSAVSSRAYSAASSCHQLRSLVEEYLGAPYSTGQAAYDLCRLLRKGLLVRLPHTHRYRLTPEGRIWITFCSGLYSRVLCAALRQHRPDQPSSALGSAYRAYEKALTAHLVAARRAARVQMTPNSA